MKYADTIIWYDAPYVYEITYEPTLQLRGYPYRNSLL